MAVDRRGRTISGVISAETATSITLTRDKDSSETILRSDLREITSTGLSLMPEGLEKKIDHQEMADLLAYLRDALPEPAVAEGPERTRDFGTLPGLVEPERKE